jgi:hypothetical protein
MSLPDRPSTSLSQRCQDNARPGCALRHREHATCAWTDADRDLLDIDSLMDFAIRVLRADFQVADNYPYEPGKTLSCPITA